MGEKFRVTAPLGRRDCFLKLPVDLGVLVMGEGVGGDDDDIVTQTPRTISPQEPFHSVFTVLS